MKFQSSSAFEKHLTFPGQESHFYLFVTPCDYEKRLWTESVMKVLRAQDSGVELKRFDATETSPMLILDEVRAPSLWGGMRVLVIEQIDKVKPIGPFLDLLSHRMKDVVLIFTASSAKPVSELYQKGKKDLIAVDVTEEKPWDKERRMQEWIREHAKKAGKELPSEVAGELIQHLGTDLATLDQELKKLIVYAHDKKVLTTHDVEAICGFKDLTTGWQLAEALVWKEPIALADKMQDLSFVFPFLGQVRYHLQLGAKLSDLIERGAPDLKKHFPTQRNLDKFTPIAKAREHQFFMRGLLHLYNFELQAKSGSIDLSALFDIFQAKLHAKTDSTS